MEAEEALLDPVARLLRELLDAPRPATLAELATIREWMATLPFDARIVPVPKLLRGAIIESQRLGKRAASLLVHLAKRTILEEQWSEDTSTEVYVEDVRRAVSDPTGQILIYPRRGGSIIAILTSPEVIPAEHRGINVLDNLLVVGSIDRGIILSAYMFTSLDQTGIPEGAIWLN